MWNGLTRFIAFISTRGWNFLSTIRV